MSKCEMSFEFDIRDCLKDIGKHLKVNFLTPDSKPESINEVIQCARHILIDLAHSLEEAAEKPKILAVFAKELGLHDGLDKEKELDGMLKDLKIPRDMKDLLKMLIMGVTERRKDCTKEKCEHE